MSIISIESPKCEDYFIQRIDFIRWSYKKLHLGKWAQSWFL